MTLTSRAFSLVPTCAQNPILWMSYPLQPQFPNMDAPTRSQPTYTPSKPVHSQQSSQAWQPQAAPNDFAFYSPPPQPQSQPMQPQQPYGMHPQQPQQQQAEGWGSDSGVHMRGGAGVGGGQMGQMGHPPAFMPAAAQQLMSNPMSSLAFDYGKASFSRNLSWVMSWLVALKYYFHVNNRYVIAKIKVILLPFLHSNWKRERMESGGAGAGGGAASGAPLMGPNGHLLDDNMAPAYRPPRDDLNAPDLYIPTMAFVTFVLVMGYALGTAGQFHPEVLGLTASRSLVLLFFEVLGLKLGLYLIAVGPAQAPTSLLDLVAYASYKYVHCIVMIVLGLVAGSFVFYGSIVVLGALAALFMMRTMKRVCTSGGGGPSGLGGDAASPHAGGSFAMQSSYGQGKHRRNYFLLIVGALQIVFAWFIVRTANQGF